MSTHPHNFNSPLRFCATAAKGRKESIFTTLDQNENTLTVVVVLATTIQTKNERFTPKSASSFPGEIHLRSDVQKYDDDFKRKKMKRCEGTKKKKNRFARAEEEGRTGETGNVFFV